MGTRYSRNSTRRGGPSPSRRIGTTTTASTVGFVLIGSGRLEAKSQRPVRPSWRYVAAKRLSQRSSVSLVTSRISMGRLPSDGFGTALAGADADAVLERQDEDLAVADAPFGTSAPGFHDGVHGRLDEILIDGDL